jgi:hypothetical protein
MASIEIEKAKALALAQAQALAAQRPKHFELGQAPGDDPSKLPAGYDPASGIVSGGAIDDKVGNLYGTGIRRAGEAAVGLGGDVMDLGASAGNWLAGQLGADPAAIERANQSRQAGRILPTSDDVRSFTNEQFGVPNAPMTTKGAYAQTMGEFAGGALGPGGPIRKVLSMALPALFSETAGQATKDTPYEPYARFGGALLGGGLTVPKGGKPIKQAAKDLGIKTKDMTRVIKRMQQDGMTPQQIEARLAELGDNATLMDVGPNLRQEGQRIYAKGGGGRSVIDDVLTPRDKGANQRIRTELDTNLGPAPVPSRVDAGLKRTQRSLSPEYERVLGNARAVNTEAIANDITSMIANTRGEAKSALEKVRDMLRIEGSQVLDPHPRAALATRQAIDGMMDSTQDSNVRRILGDFRKRLDAELSTAAPGIKDVDAKYANLAKQREAVERGQTVLDSGRTSPRPVELADEIAKGGPVIKGRLSQGARAEIDRIVGTNANDRVALQRIIKGEGDWNRDKLGQLFGQDKADRMIAVLDREGTFADTSNRVIKNSATAERLPDGADQFGKLPSWKSGGILGLARAAASDIGEAVLDKMRASSATARDSGVARIISDTDRNRIVTALIKANGGKPLPQDQIESAVRALLIAPGASASQH